MPKRIQLRRTKGWRKPEGAVNVARPTRWGSPFRVSQRDDDGMWEVRWPGIPETWTSAGVVIFPTRLAAVRFSVRRYERALVDNGLRIIAADARRELRGSDLACWCPADQPCHADVLLEVANR